MEKVKKTERKVKMEEKELLSLSVSNLPFEMKLAKTCGLRAITAVVGGRPSGRVY